MSSSFETAVDNFLTQIGQSIFRATMLNRIWQGFMAFCMCIIAEAFRRRGYTVNPQNYAHGFLFKCFPSGDPNNYSYFTADRGNEHYEIRLSVSAQNLMYHGLKLNLDVVVINMNSINQDGIVDSHNDLVAFAECKNLRGFPELVATLEGMVYELQRTRLYRDSQTNYNYRIPCCLLLSGSGLSIQHMDRRYQSKNTSLRIFESLQPGGHAVTSFINSWF